MDSQADVVFPYSAVQVIQDIEKAMKESSDRGLLHTKEWLSELLFAVMQTSDSDLTSHLTYPVTDEHATGVDYARYVRARSLFDLKKYNQCAFHAKECKNPAGRFLHFFSRFLAIDRESEAKDLDEGGNKFDGFAKLQRELQEERLSGNRDSYLLYMLGATLRKLGLPEAFDCLQEAVHLNPINWAAWNELSMLVTSQDKLDLLTLPDCWMKHFFLGNVYIELHCAAKALKYYESLEQGIFKKSLFVQTQIARVYFDLRDSMKSKEVFLEVRKQDPYRLENMDVYSNVLYVLTDLKSLTMLAHEANATEPYTVETCCIIANYYSLRGQHEKAILYLQRALKLDSRYSHAWTIMGHEHVEIKNTNAAVACYQKAVDLNPRDYRPWYGLGQAYELLKMPSYSLYYYRKAHIISPNDSRMLIAMGDVYEKLDRTSDAKKCYWKAVCIGDAETIAQRRLAKLFERLNEVDLAAAINGDLLRQTQTRDIPENVRGEANIFLAKYHLQKGNLDEAYNFAYNCLEISQCMNEGKAILKDIAQLRPKQEMLHKADMDQTFPAGKMTIEDESMSMSYTP